MELCLCMELSCFPLDSSSMGSGDTEHCVWFGGLQQERELITITPFLHQGNCPSPSSEHVKLNPIKSAKRDKRWCCFLMYDVLCVYYKD